MKSGRQPRKKVAQLTLLVRPDVHICVSYGCADDSPSATLDQAGARAEQRPRPPRPVMNAPGGAAPVSVAVGVA